jgi:hypothetical protein
MKFSDEFKEAISNLPDKEKDKLILRLLKKDLSLADRLNFELLQPLSIEDARENTWKEVQKILNYGSIFHSPGIAMMYLRDASGVINEHVSITKDKYGEIHLQLNMLSYFFQHQKERYNRFSDGPTKKLNNYIIARLYKLLGQMNSCHEDQLYDFKEITEKIGNNMSEIPTLMKTSIFNSFNINWLFDHQIPENIVQIQKDLRANGYLK